MEESTESLVSILIPTYNRENFIAEALESALSQRYSNLEIIVSDNASTDKTCAIVEEYAKRNPKIRLYANDENLGPVLNWVAGLEKAQGEFVKILWSDDLMHPDYLSRSMALFNEKSDLAFVFTMVDFGADWAHVSESLYDHFGATGVYPSRNFILGIIQGRSLPYSPGCAIFKTEILRQSIVTDNEYFNHRYLKNGAGTDLLMFLSAARLQENMGYINESLSLFRDHDQSITVSSDRLLLSLDYAKAILWFLFKYEGQDVATRYWFNVYKKQKLYKRVNRTALKSMEIKSKEVQFRKYRNVLYFIAMNFMRSKQYLTRIGL